MEETSVTQIYAKKTWPMTGRGFAADRERPHNVAALIEEVPGIDEYRWFLRRSGQPSVYFSDLDNAHAYITGHGIRLDFIEGFVP